jgi:hypothetical protein
VFISKGMDVETSVVRSFDFFNNYKLQVFEKLETQTNVGFQYLKN